MTRRVPPPHAHPLVRQLYVLSRQRGVPLYSISKRAGVSVNTVYAWATKHAPTVENLEACFNTLGYELVAQPRESIVPNSA